MLLLQMECRGGRPRCIANSHHMKTALIETLNDPMAEVRPAGSQNWALFDGVELPYRREFFPLGYGLEIQSNEPQVLIAAEESFGHMRSARQETDLKVRIDVRQKDSAVCLAEPARWASGPLFSLVADRDHQAHLDLKTGVNFTWITHAALADRLYFRRNFLEKAVYLLLGASVVTDVHAACVGRDGKGILLCGDSGAGKSTLAYACARAGWTYTSDDTSYLINDAVAPRVIGHAHRARFRPEARALFPELAVRQVIPRLGGKPSIETPIAELPVKNAAAETDVCGVVYLDRNTSANCSLVRLPRGAATERMQRELYSEGDIRARHEKKLEIFWDVPAFELRYRDLNDGIEALESLVVQI